MALKVSWTPTNEIRTEFPNLNPIQKARELAKGRKQGVSYRMLAGMFGIADGTVRNLLSLLLLSDEDQAKIECGAPYRPYLCKDSHTEAAPSGAEPSEANLARVALDCEYAAIRGPQLIRQMFANQDFTPVYAQQIVKEVLAQIRSGEKAGKIQPSEVGWVDDELAIYEYCQPTGFKDLRNIDRINAMAFWLSNVLVRVMPEVRKRAIDLALEEPERLCESVQC